MKLINKEDVVNKRYHVVIAISNTVLCAIGLICILTVMFAWFQDYIRDEMTKMSYTQLSNTAQSAQSRLDYYQMQLQNLFQEPQIKTSLYTNAEDPIQEFGIYRFLNYSIANDGIIDYAVIYKDHRVKQFVGGVYPGDEELDAAVEFLAQSQNDREIYQYYNEGKKISRLFLFRTERDVMDGPPQRGLLFAINQEKLAKSLFGEQDDGGEQNVWVFDQEGNLLLKHLDTAKEATDEVWALLKAHAEENSQSFEIEVDGESCFLIYLEGTDYRLKFAQLIDTRQITGTLQQALHRFLIGAIVVLVLCSVAAFVLAKFILDPLQKFFRSLTVSAGLTEKTGDTLTLVTSERILSEISSMSRQLHTDKVLSYLEDALQKEEPPYQLQLTKKKEAAVLVLIGSKIGRIHSSQLKVLRETLSDRFAQEIQAELYPEENRSYGLVILTEQKTDTPLLLSDRIWLEQQLKEVFQKISMTEGALYAVYSEPFTDADALQSEFRSLKERSKYVLFGDFETISCSMDYCEKLDEEIPKKTFADVIAVVKQGDDVRAKCLMPNLLNFVSGYEIKQIFHALCYLAVEIEQASRPFSNRAGAEQSAYLEHYIKLTSLINQKELYDYFSNIIEDTCLELRTAGERSLRTTMLESIQYIEEHFMDSDISVDQISTIFHVSNSYFSRMFHEICNLSFPEYVNELRLNHSAHLLQTTNLSIKEIAAKSGFSSVSYFGAQFKKKYGVSPSAYRGRLKENA